MTGCSSNVTTTGHCKVYVTLVIIAAWQRCVHPRIKCCQLFQSCDLGVTMAGTMYAMKPVFELDGVVEVPQCMYALPVIQRSDSAAPAQSAECPPGALQALETRQDAILARLERLKVEVAAYKRTLGLADSAAAAPIVAGPSKVSVWSADRFTSASTNDVD